MSPLLFLLSSAMVICHTTAQLQTSTQKLFSCDVTKYQGVLYKKDNLLGQDRWRVTDTLESCGEQCLMESGCKAVNFVASQKLCALLGSGLANANADRTLYDRTSQSLHATITCNRKPSGPVGCGTQAANYKPVLNKLRIIGGQEAKPHSWPWLVSMSIDFGNGYGAGCGSTLLRVKDGVEQSDIVLTAAHCVTSDEGTAPTAYSPKQVTVVAGNHRKDKYDDGEETRTAAEIRFHPSYKFTPQTGAVYDIALVKLATPIAFTDTIRPICPAPANEPIPVGKTCVAAGWGRNNSQNDDTPVALQQVIAPAHDAKTCQKGWYSTYKEDIMICAGSLTGVSGTCQGDSGGMLACQQDDGTWRVYGATSFGVSGTCLQAGKPSIFARVSGFADWISKNIKEMTSIK